MHKSLLLGLLASFNCAGAMAQLSLTGIGGSGSGTAPLPTGIPVPLIAENGQTGPSVSGTQYMSVSGGQTPWSGAAVNRDQPMAISGSLKNLTVRFPTALTQGTYTISLAKNGVVPAPTLTCQITTSTSTCSDANPAHEVIFAAGDTLSWQSVPSGTPTAQTEVQMAAVMTSYGADTVVNAPFNANQSTTVVNYTTMGFYSALSWNATETNVSGVVPTAGTINSIYVAQATAPGAAKSYTYTIYINGVSQGSSACLVSGASALTCNVTGLGLAVVAGDLVSIESTPSGTPANATARVSVGFTPTSAGQMPIIWAATALSGGTTRYVAFEGASASSTETNVLTIAPCATTIKLLNVKSTPALTAGQTRDQTLRKGTGGGQSSQALTCQLNSVNTTSCTDGSNSYTTTSNDLLNWASIGGATAPATTTIKISAVAQGCTP